MRSSPRPSRSCRCSRRPTVAEVARALDARYLQPVDRATGEGGVHREVGRLIVGAMGLEHFLERIVEGDLVITPGDRVDIIAGSLAAHLSGTYPGVAGLVLTGGDVPPAVCRLVEGYGDAGSRWWPSTATPTRWRAPSPGARGDHRAEHEQDRRRDRPVRGARRHRGARRADRPGTPHADDAADVRARPHRAGEGRPPPHRAARGRRRPDPACAPISSSRAAWRT